MTQRRSLVSVTRGVALATAGAAQPQGARVSAKRFVKHVERGWEKRMSAAG